MDASTMIELANKSSEHPIASCAQRVDLDRLAAEIEQTELPAASTAPQRRAGLGAWDGVAVD
jgi:hypothetical protein